MTNYPHRDYRWRRLVAVRNDDAAFARTVQEIQHEMEREARECLRVQGVKLEGNQ